MKTQKKVNKKAWKENWKKDPCWDIEDTEEFDEYHDELLEFSNEWKNLCNIEWEKKREILFQSAKVHHQVNSDNLYDGITKQELFAAMAMQALIQSKSDVNIAYI